MKRPSNTVDFKVETVPDPWERQATAHTDASDASPSHRLHRKGAGTARRSPLRVALGVIAALLCVVAVVGTLARLVPVPYDTLPFVGAVAAFGPWFGLVGLIGLILAVFGRKLLVVVLCLACCAAQAVWIAPYWIPSGAVESPEPAEAPSSSSSANLSAYGTVASAVRNAADDLAGESGQLRVMTLNSYFGQAAADAIVETVVQNGIELLCMQETTTDLTDALYAAGLDDVLPYHTGDTIGNQIWSSLPLDNETEDAVGYSGSRMPAATVEVAGQRVRFVSVHTCAPVPGYEDLWGLSLSLLAEVGTRDEGLEGGVPYVLMGDFNATTSNASFRAITQNGLRDGAMAAGEGLAFTWPVYDEVPLLVAIDHIVLDESLDAFGFSYVSIPGTDHRALMATIEIA